MYLKRIVVTATIFLVLAGCHQDVQSSSALSSPSSDQAQIASVALDEPVPSTPIPTPVSPISAPEQGTPSSEPEPSAPEPQAPSSEPEPSTPEPEAADSSEGLIPDILPSTESVVLVIEQQQIRLSDILENPERFIIDGYIANNSTEPISYSTSYMVERYDGEKWVEHIFSRKDSPLWVTGSGDLLPGDKLMKSFRYWIFEEELTPGAYRFAIGVGPGFFYDNPIPIDSFKICAYFEII